MTDTPATHRVTEGLPDPDAALRLLAEAEAADGVEAFGEAFVRVERNRCINRFILMSHPFRIF